MRKASTNCVDEYIASIWDRLRTTLWEVLTQSKAKACQQKRYYDRKIGIVNLKPGHLVLVKADAFKGKRKIKDRWEEDTWEVVHQIATDVSSYEMMDQHGKSCPPLKSTSSHCIRGWHSLVYGYPSCMGEVY